MLHWTYKNDLAASADLDTGDILFPTEDLLGVLKKVHPHFVDAKYVGFLVLTQSCDLVRRDGKECKAKHINIATIRLLEHALLHFLDATCDSLMSGVYFEDQKSRAKALIERILNQNEEGLGLFYLHPETALGIDEPAVALLRISIALRSEHYPILREARRGTLASEFKHKLGWLMGNLYARVGTEDWSEPPERKSELGKLITQTLEPLSSPTQPFWISREACKAAKRAGVDLANIPRNEVVPIVSRHRAPPKIEDAVSRIVEIARLLGVQSENPLPEPFLKKLYDRLRSDPPFAEYIKR